MGERKRRLEKLLTLEIRRVTEELGLRRDLLIRVWGEQRARAPFLDTVFTRWKTLPFTELLQLEQRQVESCSAFYRELDRMRLYLETTQDMPRALTLVFDGHLARLELLAQAAVGALEGGPVEINLEVDFDDLPALEDLREE